MKINKKRIFTGDAGHALFSLLVWANTNAPERMAYTI